LKYKIKIISLMFIFYLMAAFSYVYIIQPEFSYMLFTLNFGYAKIIIGLVFMIIFLLLLLLLDDYFYFSTLGFLYFFFVFGTVIYFQFSNDSNIISMINISIFIVVFIGISKLKIFYPAETTESGSVFDKIYAYGLLLLMILLLIPFFAFYEYVDINNLILLNIYETREVFRGFTNPLLGYLFSFISRVLAPAVLVIGIRRKNIMLVVLSSLAIIFLFLLGALKSVLFTFFLVIIFYKGSFKEKVLYFYMGITILIFFGILLYYSFDNVILLDLPIRRMLFIPSYLDVQYIDYFSNNFIGMDGISFLFINFDASYLEGLSVTRYFGEVIMGREDWNANVGILTSGYIRFSFYGVFINSLFVILSFKIISMHKFEPRYFGILLAYIYYFNTSFLSVLLVSHGYIFFVLFAFIFMRREILNKKGISD